jgi:hypothetical protein
LIAKVCWAVARLGGASGQKAVAVAVDAEHGEGNRWQPATAAPIAERYRSRLASMKLWGRSAVAR